MGVVVSWLFWFECCVRLMKYDDIVVLVMFDVFFLWLDFIWVELDWEVVELVIVICVWYGFCMLDVL